MLSLQSYPLSTYNATPNYYDVFSPTVPRMNLQSRTSGSVAYDMEQTPFVTRYKTQLCEKFMSSGSCPYYHRCMFAHGEDELRTMEQNLHDRLTSKEAITMFQRGAYFFQNCGRKNPSCKQFLSSPPNYLATTNQDNVAVNNHYNETIPAAKIAVNQTRPNFSAPFVYQHNPYDCLVLPLYSCQELLIDTIGDENFLSSDDSHLQETHHEDANSKPQCPYYKGIEVKLCHSTPISVSSGNNLAELRKPLSRIQSTAESERTELDLDETDMSLLGLPLPKSHVKPHKTSLTV